MPKPYIGLENKRIWCGKGVTSRHSGWFRSDPKVDE